MSNDKNYILAIDIGGTKISAALVDPDGRIFYRQELPTLANEGRSGILGRLETLGQALINQAPSHSIIAVSAASAGQIDIRSGRVNYATDNLPGWNQLDLTNTLEMMFKRPATADNDVNAMAVAEMAFGAGRGAQDVFCVMVGTGVGGALILNGALYHGSLGGAGEFGHLSIQAFGGRLCNCGGTGCVEVYASSRAVLHDFTALAGEQEISQRLGIHSADLTIQNFADAFHNQQLNDWRALHETVAQAAEALGAGIASAINLVSPQRVVIAGSIQLLGDPYLAAVKQSMQRRAMTPRRTTQLCFSQLGSDPALVGAALLARQRLFPS